MLVIKIDMILFLYKNYNIPAYYKSFNTLPQHLVRPKDLVSQGFRPSMISPPWGQIPRDLSPPQGQIPWDLTLPACPPLGISTPLPTTQLPRKLLKYGLTIYLTMDFHQSDSEPMLSDIFKKLELTS